MTVSVKDIHHIARLSRLLIDEAQIPDYTKNLNNLLKLVEQMNQVDTTSIEPMSHPQAGQQQRYREDAITEVNQRDLFQTLAPNAVEGLYLVPKVIDAEE